jgi:hypothetical protein
MENILPIVLALAAFTVGVISCFFGHRLFNVILVMWGFIGGAVIGITIAAGNVISTQMIYAVIGGIIGAVLSRLLYYVGVFIIGVSFGMSLALVAAGFLGINQPPLLLAAICGIIGGIAAIVLSKWMIMVATAFSGASLIVLGVMLLFGRYSIDSIGTLRLTEFPPTSPTYDQMATIAWLILGILGFMIQYRANRNRRDASHP